MLRDALVVGVNTYQNLPGLKAPARDAEAVAKTLQTYGEFRVHRLPEVIQAGQPQIGQKTQVTLQMLESALIQLFKPKGRSVAQTALFYFSGHGLQREAGIREGFLAPSNADPDRGFYGLSLFWLRRLLQESPVRQRIIILDCCHSGELLNFLEADPGAAPGTDRLFMAASREYETAYESIDSPYSVFTQALLTGLDPQRSTTGIVNHHALTDWVNHQLKGEIQQPLFESSGSEIILTRRIAGVDCSLGGTASHQFPVETALHRPLGSISFHLETPPVCPYRGLECFDESHAEFFFGREALSTELLQKLKTNNFIAVVGASGIGKSSLVRAGLIPLLRQSNQTGTDWQIKLITPSEHPLKSLAAAFVDPEADPIERAEQLRRAEQLLQAGEAGFVQLVRGTMPQNFGTTGLSSRRSQLLLVIDQFEEIFTQGHAQSDRERQQFIACLMAAVEAGCLKAMVVLRSDFVPQCRQYEPLVLQIAQHSVIVPPLKYDQLKAAIVRPAQKAGLRCEPNLVYTLLLDVIGAPGELSLLQSTLLELWQRRQPTPEGIECLTLDSYREFGGIRQLLQERATDVFHRFDTAEQAIAQRIFLTLTHFGEGTEDTRRRVFKSQLVSPTFAPEKTDLVERILEKLVSAKLLVTDQAGLNVAESSGQDDRGIHHPGLGDAGLFSVRDRPAEALPDWSDRLHSPTLEKSTQAVVDVAHEALIRHWSLLRQWCSRDREMLVRQRELEEAARIWYDAGQPASIEFLLAGRRLEAAEELVADRSHELSALTQEFILASRKEAQRARRESRQLQIAVPAFLMATLTIVMGQYFNALQSQIEKEQQLRLATARERAAITQSILQEVSNSESGSSADAVTTALLIGRLAAQEKPTEAAQTSLRLALQSLRLQLKLPITHSSIQQLEISPDRGYLAAASAEGKIRLWTIQPYQLYGSTSTPQPGQVLDWTIGAGQGLEETVSQDPALQANPLPCRPIAGCPPGQNLSAPTLSQREPLRIASVRFSSNSQSIAAFAEGLPDIKVWSTQYGALVLHLKGSAPVTQLHYSPVGEWLVSVHADRSLAIWRGDTGKLQARLLYPKPIEALQFSPDGQFLQVSFENDLRRYRLIQTANTSLYLQPAASPIQAELIQAKQVQAKQVQAKQVQAKQLQRTVFSPQGNWTATLSTQGQVSLWRSQTGQLLHRFPIDQDAKVQFSPNDQTLSILTEKVVWLYDISTRHLKQLPLVSGKATALTFSMDGRWLVTRSSSAMGNGKQVIQLWDGKSGESVGRLPQDSEVTEVRFSPDNAYLITGDAQGQLKFWAVQTGGELPTLEQANAPASQISFLENGLGQNYGSQLLTIAANGQVQPWRLPAVSAAPAQPARSIPASAIHTAALKSESFWQKLTELAAQTDLLAKAEAALPRRASAKQPEVVQPIQAEAKLESIPGTIVRSGWRETILHIAGWSSLPSSAAGSVLANQSSFSSVALSADGEWFATADLTGTIALQQRQPNQTFQTKHQIRNWRIGSQLLLSQKIMDSVALPSRPKDQSSVKIYQLHFSPDRQFLLGVGDDLTVRLWNVESGELVQVWNDHQATIHQVRFSPDGSQIITASQDKTAQVLEVKAAHSGLVASGKPTRVLTHDTAVTSSSFSPERQQIVTGSEDGKARIYDRATGQLRFVLAGHQKKITDVQYSPAGDSIVTASADGTAIVWNARTGQQQALLNPPRQQDGLQPLVQAAFSPDGQYVATLTQTGQVYLWAATWGHLLALAQERTPRQLTSEECSRYLNLSFDQCPKLPL
jgi:WD40 repeat protein